MWDYQYKYSCTCDSLSSTLPVCYNYAWNKYDCFFGNNSFSCSSIPYYIYSNVSLESFNGCNTFSFVWSAWYSLSCSNWNCIEIIDPTSWGGWNIEEILPAPEVSETLGVWFPNYTWNVISSVNGAIVTLDNESLAVWVGEPMFFWYWQLINVALI